jgi:hypothetical protein
MPSRNAELLATVLPQDADLVAMTDSPTGFMGAGASFVSPDLEVRFTGGLSGGTGTEYRGPEGFIEGWRDWLEPYESYRIHFDEPFDAGDKVVTFATVKARTARHGVEVEHAPAAVWTIENGQLVAVSFFLDRDVALEYAGIGTR